MLRGKRLFCLLDSVVLVRVHLLSRVNVSVLQLGLGFLPFSCLICLARCSLEHPGPKVVVVDDLVGHVLERKGLNVFGDLDPLPLNLVHQVLRRIDHFKKHVVGLNGLGVAGAHKANVCFGQRQRNPELLHFLSQLLRLLLQRSDHLNEL